MRRPSSATIATRPSCATIAINPSSGITGLTPRSATTATKHPGGGAELRRLGSVSHHGSSARGAYVHSRLLGLGPSPPGPLCLLLPRTDASPPMPPLPADIFTEPEDVSPDGLANLGPLRRLAGSWQADKGLDINPKAEGPERRTFIERIRMDPIDPQANGPQLLYGLRYHIHINTPEEDITFHDQVGYWLWEPATGLIMQTLAIPRGQVALAKGEAAADGSGIVIRAERGGPGYGICSTDFLEWAFRTDSYELDVRFAADG